MATVTRSTRLKRTGTETFTGVVGTACENSTAPLASRIVNVRGRRKELVPNRSVPVHGAHRARSSRLLVGLVSQCAVPPGPSGVEKPPPTLTQALAGAATTW